jgi:alpha-galactosidase-like protein
VRVPAARRILTTLTLAWLAATLAFAPPLAAQDSDEESSHVVLVDMEVEARVVNVTLTTYSRPGWVRSAGLFVNESLVSNQTGGLWLTYGTKGNLSFRLLDDHREVDLRLAYETTQKGNETVSAVTIPLSLPAGPDVRPLDAWVDAGGNVTVTLANFGRTAAQRALASLQDAENGSLGLPYYREVPPMAPGERAEVRFTLVATSEKPLLVIETGEERRSHTLVLRSAEGGGSAPSLLSRVEFATDFPSLEATAGSTAQFPLRLVNRGPEVLVALGVEGLPEPYTSSFTVQGSRVQTVLLGSGATRDVTLSVGVPSSGNESGGPPLRFDAWVATAGAAGQRLASAPLTLTVSGAAQLELAGRNWFATAEPGQVFEATLDVYNRGTAAAHDVALAVDGPSGWEVTFTPARIARLGPGETAKVAMRVAAPEGTSDGRYVLDVGAESPVGNARERSFSVEMAHPAPSQLPWLLAAGLAGVGAVALVVRARRR